MADKVHSLLHLKEFRKALRGNLTPAEAALWSALKGRQLCNRKFIRQHSIENFIVDFYCPAEKLIVELDGQVHYNHEASLNDHERDKQLSELGFKVIRFENKLVFSNLSGVLSEIATHFNDTGASLYHP